MPRLVRFPLSRTLHDESYAFDGRPSLWLYQKFGMDELSTACDPAIPVKCLTQIT